jgi:hypothetical protein
VSSLGEAALRLLGEFRDR